MISNHTTNPSIVACDKAVAAVEFALVLPILILVLFAIVELSTLLYDKSVITNASREAARVAVVNTSITDGEIQTFVINYCQNKLITFGSKTNPTVSIARPLGSNSGNPIIVTVSYSFTGLLLGQLIQPTNWSQLLSASTTMNFE
jgi:Flp pilus assembly protein TadG